MFRIFLKILKKFCKILTQEIYDADAETLNLSNLNLKFYSIKIVLNEPYLLGT